MYHLYQKFPTLYLDNIVLRELSENDAENYYNYMDRLEMQAFIIAANRPANLQQALEEMRYWKSLFHNKRSFYWGIALRDTGKLIGTSGFNIISPLHSKAEISYDLDPEFWSKGIMTKSIKAMLQFVDSHLKLVRIQATVIQDNIRSIKLLERSGFLREGQLKKYEFVDGQHKDYYMYARVK